MEIIYFKKAERRYNNMMNKKGLSDIIATVLIVLLALAAVVIVWTFVQPMFTKSGETLSLQNKCLQVEVAPVSCTLTGIPSPGSYNINGVLKLNKGSATGITAIAELTDGTTKVTTVTPAPAVLSTAAITQITYIGSKAIRLKAAAVVASDKDPTQTQTCDVSPTVVSCTCTAPACT